MVLALAVTLGVVAGWSGGGFSAMDYEWGGAVLDYEWGTFPSSPDRHVLPAGSATSQG
ncbi:hypothetical protein [Phytohabitans houttuyneae]|uniref:hypothetical protein n=1 Tax=Phytohabitans houttuyneae TaxID=1076126 RepID=UPI00156364C3|nr:hypothetical protein [Phytohabitans houttuyneae]